MDDTLYAELQQSLDNLDLTTLDPLIAENFQRLRDIGIVPLASCQGHYLEDKAYLLFTFKENSKLKVFDLVDALEPLMEDYLPEVGVRSFEVKPGVSIHAIGVHWFPCDINREALNDIVLAIEKSFI